MKLDRFYAQANEQEAALQDDTHAFLHHAISPCQQLEERYSSLITQQEHLRRAWHSAPDALRDMLRNTSLGHLLEGL
ncbi:hypothetical protein GCM10010082_12070 [Kushneria pakistanensis]|uniref:Uncharacterized protein n=1 Tax=Kushneria pakistanensis TaxID=1508770 RepID=A0ABQ3FFE3_9GAMM|nr:hypothetical protein [Kushneria pakistanensis]GHC21839.1 hypothetical protein GCM10010082_12070 [Kushneria pakistanensis]